MTDKESFMSYINEAYNNNKFTSNNIFLYWDKLIINLKREELISENYTMPLSSVSDTQMQNKSSSSTNNFYYQISSNDPNSLGDLIVSNVEQSSDQTLSLYDTIEDEEKTKDTTNTSDNEFDYDLFEELYRALIKVDKKTILEELNKFNIFIKTNFTMCKNV